MSYGRPFATIIKNAEADFVALNGHQCQRLEAKLVEVGIPRDLVEYTVAQFRQMAQADTARRIAALRREGLKVVN